MGQMSPQEIYENFHVKARGSQSLQDASDAAKRLADTLADRAKQLHDEVNLMRRHWQGSAAEAATLGTAPLIAAHVTMGENNGTTQGMSQSQADGFHLAKNSTTPVLSEAGPNLAGGSSMLVHGDIDPVASGPAREHLRQQAMHGNIAAYSTYHGTSTGNAALPNDPIKLPTSGPAVQVRPRSAPAGEPGMAAPSVSGPSGQTPTWFPAPGATPYRGAPTTTPETGTAPATTEHAAAPATTGSGDELPSAEVTPTDTRRWSDPATTGNDRRPQDVPGMAGAPGGDQWRSRTPAPPTRTPVGKGIEPYDPGARNSNPAGRVVPGHRERLGGRRVEGNGNPRDGAPTSPPGERSGIGYRGGSPVARPSTTGEPIRGGAPAREGMGMTPMGSAGGRGDDKRRKSTYTKGPDPEEYFGTDEKTPPPVIGARHDNDPKSQQGN